MSLTSMPPGLSSSVSVTRISVFVVAKPTVADSPCCRSTQNTSGSRDQYQLTMISTISNTRTAMTAGASQRRSFSTMAS